MSYTIAIPDPLMERVKEYGLKHNLAFSNKAEAVKHIIREFLKFDNGGINKNCQCEENDVRK